MRIENYLKNSYNQYFKFIINNPVQKMSKLLNNNLE